MKLALIYLKRIKREIEKMDLTQFNLSTKAEIVKDYHEIEDAIAEIENNSIETKDKNA